MWTEKLIDRARDHSGITLSRSLFVTIKAALLGMLLAAQVTAAEIRIAVESDFEKPMRRIVQWFEQETGHKVIVSYESTERIKILLADGTPFQLLVAPVSDDLAAAVQGTKDTIALAQIALWSPDPGKVDPQGAILRTGSFEHLAITNPDRSAYGRAAWSVLEQMGLTTRITPVLVQGHSVRETYELVASGDVTLGFVALSQVWLNGRLTRGSLWIPPAGWYRTIEMKAMLLTHGRHSPAAKALLEFLQSPAARQTIVSYGYLNPDSWSDRQRQKTQD